MGREDTLVVWCLPVLVGRVHLRPRVFQRWSGGYTRNVVSHCGWGGYTRDQGSPTVGREGTEEAWSASVGWENTQETWGNNLVILFE